MKVGSRVKVDQCLVGHSAQEDDPWVVASERFQVTFGFAGSGYEQFRFEIRGLDRADGEIHPFPGVESTGHEEEIEQEVDSDLAAGSMAVGESKE